MKDKLQALASKIDALTLRERIFVFGGLVGVVCYLLYFGVLNSLYDKQKDLRTKISHARNNVEGFNADIAVRSREYAADPDAPNRAKLAQVKAEADALGTTLRTMQKALVPPERIVPVIASILKNSKHLRLVSLKKLPVVGFNDPAPGAATRGPIRLDAPGAATSERAVMATTKAEMTAAAAAAGTQAPGTVSKASDMKMPNGAPLPFALPGAPVPATTALANAGAPPPAPAPAPGPAAPAVKPPDLLFRHGVEITLSGSYLDMIAYMEALESLPTQLFWGKAEFEVENYPNARLTLTLYTLSMDKKWMTL
jgi:MSHA biogenesis protein MshJ